jgi:uncharacterized protein with FMN-binding domain
MADKIKSSLVAASFSAILAVYAAGYERTRSAAEELDARSTRTRVPDAPGVPATAVAALPTVEAPAAELGNATSTDVLPVGEVAKVAEVPVATGIVPVSKQPGAKEPESNQAVATNVAPSTVATTPVAPDPAKPEPTPVAAVEPTPAVATSAVATPAPVAPAPAPAPAKSKWKDGSFTGWGQSRHGDIEATVVIANGRIQRATISQCETRYPCDVIEQLPPQVAARQSADVDYVSRATESANAFYYAVTQALKKAEIEP